MGKLIVSILSVLILDTFTDPTIPLKPIYSTDIQVPEPSDLAFHPRLNALMVVSDEGYIYECGLPEKGKKLKPTRKGKHRGSDLEAVCVVNDRVVAVEERFRRLLFFTDSLEYGGWNKEVPYSGGKNKAYEGITWDSQKNEYYLFTEKEPSRCLILNSDFQIVKEKNIKVDGDISGATFYENKIYIVSDEGQWVARLHPETLVIEAKYSIPVWNAEGICFQPDGKMLVMSDDMAKIYVFELPSK